MIPDLWSSRGESRTSKSGFYPGNTKERCSLCCCFTDADVTLLYENKIPLYVM